MDPTGGVNPTFPVSDGSAPPQDYNALYQGANPYQIPAQPTAPNSQQSAPGASAYTAATPTQNQFYPQQNVQATTRPDWQQQIYTDLSNQSYATQQQAATPPPAVQQQSAPLPNYSPVSQSPYTSAASAYSPTAPAQAEQQYQPMVMQASPATPVVATPYVSTSEPSGPLVIPLDDNYQIPHTRKALVAGISVVIVVVLAGIGFGAYTIGGNAGYKRGTNDTRKEQARKLAEAAEQELGNEEDDDEASLDFSLLEPQYVEESIEGLVGEQVQSSDGFVLYVKSVERDFQPVSSTYQVNEKSELVKVNILVGNAATTQSKTVKNDNFTVKLIDGTVVSSAKDIGTYDGQVGTVTLTPGGKARFSVIFNVPKGANGLSLLRQQSYTLQGSGQTINMQTQVALE